MEQLLRQLLEELLEQFLEQLLEEILVQLLRQLLEQLLEHGTGGEAPPEAPRLTAGHPVQCYGGGKSARLFAMSAILDSDLVGAFFVILTTVSGKWPKRTLQKWSTEPSQPSQPPPLYIIIYSANGTIRLRRLRRGLYLRIPTQKPVAAGLHPAATGCDGCDGCDARFCTF